MNKAKLALLEKAFDASIYDNHGLLQTKSKVAESLEADGMIRRVQVRIPDRLGCVVLDGYQITDRGHITFCQHAASLPDDEDEDDLV